MAHRPLPLSGRSPLGVLGVAAIFAAALVPAASSQSFNLDVGMNLSVIAPTPSDGYAAAAQQPGAWMGFFPSLTPSTLDGLDGLPTPVTLRSDATSTFNVFPGVMAPGDDQALMEDFHLTPNLNTASIWTFEGLVDGRYTLYTYASDPSIPSLRTEVDVASALDPAQEVGAGWPGAHTLGQTYARHSVDVTGGTLVVTASPVGGQLETGVLNGFQLVFESALGTGYCTATANSTGSPASISASGSATVAANDLTLTADTLPVHSFGFFLASRDAGFVMNPAGSAGNLCVGGAIGRYVGPGQIRNSGATGSFSLALDLASTPQPNGLVSIAAGETWRFQAWHRDMVGGAATSNFTGGLEVVFS